VFELIRDFLDRVEKEVTSRDYRVTGIELVCCNEKRNRVHLVVSVARGERQEIRLPVSISMENVQAGNLYRAAGLILQAVDLGTWGSRDFKRVRDSLSITA
jgi:hypothetical protein